MNPKEEIKELQYELNITLEALLLSSGVKEASLDEAVQAYIEHIDEFSAQSELEGASELLAYISWLKSKQAQLFN